MTNEMMVRGAKSAKIGKSLTGYLILSADGGEGGWTRHSTKSVSENMYETYISLTKSDANIDSCSSVMGKPE